MTGFDPKPFRLQPRLEDLTRDFWTGGERGELTFQACTACSYIVHPPVAFCPRCHGREVAPRVVSGRGTVHSFTVNHHPWNPTMPERYTIALVEIEEQRDVRLMTNVLGDPDEVSIGMPVQVTFEQHDEIFFPLFEKVPTDG